MKRLISSGLVLLIALFSISPGLLSAQSLAEREVIICTNLPERSEQIKTEFEQRKNKFIDAAKKYQEEAAGRRIMADESLKNRHQEYDNMYKLWLSQSQASASSQERKQAVQVFYDEIRLIVDVQRTEYAEARKNYRNAVDMINSERYLETETKIDGFKSKVDLALEKAKLSCSRGNEVNAAIRESLVIELAAARLEYAEYRRQQPKYKDQIILAIEQRNEATKKSKQKYETEFQLAYNNFTPEVDNESLPAMPSADN